MGTILIVSILLALVASAPSTKLVAFFTKLGASFLVAFLWCYLDPPSLTGPLWGVFPQLIILLTINFAIGSMIGEKRLKYRFGDRDLYERNVQPDIPSLFALVSAMLLLSIWGIGTSPFFNPEPYAKMIGEVTKVENVGSPADPSHMRLVSIEQAQWMGNKALGQGDGTLGTRFHPGNYSLQKVNDKLYFVSPLEFNNFRRWQSSDGTPGYVLVDAENPAQPAQLVQKVGEKNLVFRYTPSAFFSYNLKRHIFSSGYATYEQWDYHLELDDNMVPHWVVTLVRPTYGFSCEKIAKVLLVDPSTGKIQDFSPSEVPSWVDRVVPDDLAVNYITWWGSYKEGWLAAYWTGLGTKEPTTTVVDPALGAESVWLVYDKAGNAEWFTGMTSISAQDQALVSVMTIDSRTGQAREVSLNGIHEQAVMSAVNSSVSNFAGYHATQPILYNIAGTPSWVVPVLSADHIFQRVAIVRADNGQVALGVDQNSALREYNALLARAGNATTQESFREYRLTISRIGRDVQNGNTLYYVRDNEYPIKVFILSSTLSPWIPTLEPGDVIVVKTAGDGEALNAIEFSFPSH